MHVCLLFCGHNCMRYYPGERDSLLGAVAAVTRHTIIIRGKTDPHKEPPHRRATWCSTGPRDRACLALSLPILLSSCAVVRRRERDEISPFDAQLQRRRFFIRSFFTAEPSTATTVTTENSNRCPTEGQRQREKDKGRGGEDRENSSLLRRGGTWRSHPKEILLLEKYSLFDF